MGQDRKLEPEQDRQTQTDATENITTPYLLVVKINIALVNAYCRIADSLSGPRVLLRRPYKMIYELRLAVSYAN